MFRYLILVTLFSILFFTALCIYGHPINREINVPFTYTKVSDGNFWDITVEFDGRTKTYSQRKGKGVSGFPVSFDGVTYIINTYGTGDVFRVRKLVPINHEHDQPTVPRSTPIQTPESSPRAPSDPSPESSPDVSSNPLPVNTGTPDPETVTLTESVVFKLRITEYMLRDWSRSGLGRLPQWVEIYNPNAKPMSLDGYQFTYAYRRFANYPWTYKTEYLPNLMIPAQGAVIIASKHATKVSTNNVIAGIPIPGLGAIP